MMLVSNCGFDFDALKGTTLVIPSVSLGNVPQLTVDLLIETLNLPRVGFWNTSTLIPVVGSSAYSNLSDSNGLPQATSLNGEIYYDKTNSITLLQFRAPIAQGFMNNFVTELGEVISKYGFQHVLVLSSFDMTLRIDSQIQNAQIRWLCPKPSLEPSISLPDAILKLEIDQEATGYSMEEPALKEETLPMLPGSGFTRKLLLLSRQKDLDQITALFSFVSEGDNRGDAINFANSLANLLNFNLDTTSWKVPPSWDSLFGTEIPLELYN